MSPDSFGKTLVIADPRALQGEGESAALFATQFFSSFGASTSSCEVRFTESREDARIMASSADGYRTVIALGGDGVVHEVVNGMMAIPNETRPRLGIVPLGAGSDFARTLHMSRNDPRRALTELAQGFERTIDLGRVNDEYFMQTLSFGLDAAIAHDAIDRWSDGSRKPNDILFVTSGFKVLWTNLRGWRYDAIVDGEHIAGSGTAFAVQNGPTYGGGFHICPNASPNDGKLDLFLTLNKPTLPHSLMLFGLIRFGLHTKSHIVDTRRVRHIEVSFSGPDQPPCQIDGKRIVAERYVVDVVPSGLDVIVSKNCSW